MKQPNDPRATAFDETIDPATGMQGSHTVLKEEERAKGFIRPVREEYKHEKCGTTTRMGRSIAETYAREPTFYGSTFCMQCGTYGRVGEQGEFVWLDGTKVGV